MLNTQPAGLRYGYEGLTVPVPHSGAAVRPGTKTRFIPTDQTKCVLIVTRFKSYISMLNRLGSKLHSCRSNRLKNGTMRRRTHSPGADHVNLDLQYVSSNVHTGREIRKARLPGNNQIPLIHHEYRHTHTRRGRERERDGVSAVDFRTAGMPELLAYFKVAYAMRVQPSQGRHVKSNASCRPADVFTLPVPDANVEGDGFASQVSPSKVVRSSPLAVRVALLVWAFICVKYLPRI